VAQEYFTCYHSIIQCLQFGQKHIFPSDNMFNFLWVVYVEIKSRIIKGALLSISTAQISRHFTYTWIVSTLSEK
jgi:hypothetical protein